MTQYFFLLFYKFTIFESHLNNIYGFYVSVSMLLYDDPNEQTKFTQYIWIVNYFVWSAGFRANNEYIHVY